MRTLLVTALVLGSSALIIPVSEPQALPIDGVTLVAEQHSDLDQAIAAGKNGKTGKNGHGGAYQLGGGHGSLFGTSVGTDMGGQELVAIDLR